jgi:hypothetical protein
VRTLFGILFVAFGIFPLSLSQAEDKSSFRPETFLNCDKDCAVTLFGGKLVEVKLEPGEINSSIIAGALSRDLVNFQNSEIDGELGIAKRFGGMHETEFWAAAGYRWRWFPWNEYLVTTVAFSVGLSYASGVADYEVSNSVVGHGNRLLAYLAPEVTLALPSHPDWQFLARIHHRSGGGIFWRDDGLFNGQWGASQYLVFGVRHWY